MTKKSLIYNLIYVAVGVIAIVLLWTLLAVTQDKPLLFPTVGQILQQMFSLLGSAAFYLAVFNTLLRCILAFVLAIVIAFVLVLTVAVFPAVGRILAPIIALLRAFPTMSVILIALVWLNSRSSPVLVGFLIAFPLLYSNLLNKVTDISVQLTDMCKVYQVDRTRRITRMYIPAILPQLAKETSAVFPVVIKVVIAGEVLAYTANSMGMEMFEAKLDINIALLLAWSIVAVLLGYIVKLLVWGVEKGVSKCR